MTSSEILKADVLDILFDNRNKQYGAYTLRKNYNSRLFLALGISLSSILFLFLLIKTVRSSHTITGGNSKEEVVIDQVIPPGIKKPDPILPKRANPGPPTKTERLTTLQIKPDDRVTTAVPDQQSLSISTISDSKLDGLPSLDIAIIKNTVSADAVKPQITNAAEVLSVEREPEFPGGQTAWINFLKKNLMAPEQLEPGDKKMVSIRFQVSAEGVVTDFEIIQSAGKVFDNEVIRVLKKMPRWKPALEKGQPVSRAFSQPVTFVGIEQ